MMERLSFYILSVFLFTGCAGVQTHEEWDRVKISAMERTGLETRWERTQEDVNSAQSEINDLTGIGAWKDRKGIKNYKAEIKPHARLISRTVGL